MVVWQCTHKLVYIINQDIYLETVSVSYDPLAQIDIVDKAVLSQTEDHYTFSIV